MAPSCCSIRRPSRVVLHRLQQAIGLGAAGFLVQRVALEGGEVLPVEQQAVHVAGAVGQPFDAVAVRDGWYRYAG